MRAILVIVAIAVAGCNQISEPPQVSLKLVGLEGQTALVAATNITQRYYAEKRYERVMFPDEKIVLGAVVSRKAMEAAVVQPVFEENNPDGEVYIRCKIDEPIRSVGESMALLCEKQIRGIASELKIQLLSE